MNAEPFKRGVALCIALESNEVTLTEFVAPLFGAPLFVAPLFGAATRVVLALVLVRRFMISTLRLGVEVVIFACRAALVSSTARARISDST
ncbi:MAG: hypothetical protein ACYDEP_01235 [Acidimicrobiales bacterium]